MYQKQLNVFCGLILVKFFNEREKQKPQNFVEPAPRFLLPGVRQSYKSKGPFNLVDPAMDPKAKWCLLTARKFVDHHRCNQYYIYENSFCDQN